jgi:hypothetical protein
MVTLRKSTPTDKLEQELQSVTWADPDGYAANLGPAPAHFQYGLQDEEWVPLQDTKDYFARSSGPKEISFYDSDHALNAQARGDRFAFLREHPSLSPLPAGRLEDVPQIK